MGRFFSMDNKFFTFMNKVADLCILNIICLVCCIPIVTAGASITAMYYVTLKMVRNEEAYIVWSFFKSFKDNFKQATIINLIMIAVGAVLYLDLNVAKNMPGTRAWAQRADRSYPAAPDCGFINCQADCTRTEFATRRACRF